MSSMKNIRKVLSRREPFPMTKVNETTRSVHPLTQREFEQVCQKNKTIMETYTNKMEHLMSKMSSIVCCQNGCCDRCFQSEAAAISRDDIVYEIPPRQRSNSSSPVKSRERIDSESTKGSITSVDSLASRRSNATPIIDMKPIEFWTANRENIQPRTPRLRMSSDPELVSNIQPDLYEPSPPIPEESLTDDEKLARYGLGEVHFSVQYDIPTKRLIIEIIKARDLPRPGAMDESKQDLAHSNPYARISLLPDQKNSRQTTVQRKTQDPLWEDTFSFDMSLVEAQKRTLEILIKDFDRFSRHCVIGQVHVSLENMNIVKRRHMWKPLSPADTRRQELGEILLSINYLPSAGRLNVDIIKAKQLLQTDLIGGSDPFVKVTLLLSGKSIKTKKTTTKKNTIDPVFNESFSFDVAQDLLETASLRVTVWDYNSKSRDDFVGRIVIGQYGTGPNEATHWQQALRQLRTPVAQWHTLRSLEECEAMMVVQTPKSSSPKLA